MPFKKGVRASLATEFKPGQSGNPHGRPSNNVWLNRRGTPPEPCPAAQRRTFNPRWFALHLGVCARCRAVVSSLALISKR
jgi:hypothetical protein